ncbi:ketol-acid reductoisomerase [Buchnera aphidicola]|uniref:Ketol-acid reductoisomerase (NADP(+)) n=1 Tax=Buchnera aphidicola (Sarucallis kahawaluokalani) TaxID=1241878 RepID=A0A4D6YJS5_9GAMM|nr:ketol-acid reductoisomerase [Buchnera aphidicola]QCI26204.1 ketol-acid reductoisomerase [Buchnera aphidicola (Sarucallis kahawaluokalani)]
MKNYFNILNFRNQIIQLQQCKLLHEKVFQGVIDILKNKKIVIIGCGAQGLNQGLNMRDSGLDISYALKKESIMNKNQSWKNAIDNNFPVGDYDCLIPEADLVINLTPDKQHSQVIANIQPLMKKNSILGYSHGFNIVEIGEIIRKDITVVMVAPKCPGTEVREEYVRGFGVPALIAVHTENDPLQQGLEIAKAWAFSIGSHRAGVLQSSFIAEVKSDLMGEQTILCGLLQSSSIVIYDYLISHGYTSSYSVKLLQYGWEILTEALKHGGINLMLSRLSNAAKFRVCELSNNLKIILKPLFEKHMDDIISGSFSRNMVIDWNNQDKNLFTWRKKIQYTAFEQAAPSNDMILEIEYFQKGILMVAILKAGVELAFETMLSTGIKAESAYYESLHELPLIANTIARKRLYEMNLVISDTAEYGSYLFTKRAIPMLNDFIRNIRQEDIGMVYPNTKINNIQLENLNQEIYNHDIEKIGRKLRSYMKNMKSILDS